MSSHHVTLHQGSDGADVPQSLVKRKQLRREVEGSETPAGATQATLLLTGQRRNPAPQQSIRLHRGTQEWIGILGKNERKDLKKKSVELGNSFWDSHLVIRETDYYINCFNSSMELKQMPGSSHNAHVSVADWVENPGTVKRPPWTFSRDQIQWNPAQWPSCTSYIQKLGCPSSTLCVTLLAIERNFWVSLFSGAAQGTDAHVQQNWLHHSHRLEGQTPHWCSFCSSSGPWQMKLCSGKFSAALTLPSVLAHPQCSEEEEKELSKRRMCDSFCLWACNRPWGRSWGHRGICGLWVLINLHGDQQ